MPHVITQYYLPPDRGDIPTFSSTEAGTRFSDPRGMQGWVYLSTAVKVHSLCPRLHITAYSGIRDKQPFTVRFKPCGGHCRISPPRFLAKCCKRQLNQGSFVLLYFRLSTFSDLYWVCLSVFSCTVLFVSISQVIGCKDRLWNDLYCVEWGVKLYSKEVIYSMLEGA